jgi:membrane protein implicated in regulation of membrane protease activity
MTPVYIWILVALLLFIIELCTAGFAVICLAVGAGGAAIAAALSDNVVVQVSTFAIVSILSIAALRPVLKRTFMRGNNKVRTNADAMIGRHGVVCAKVDDDEGRVMIDGVDWKARSEDGTSIAEGTKVEVIKMDSIVLIVKKL